jgi:hypothetical protein
MVGCRSKLAGLHLGASLPRQLRLLRYEGADLDNLPPAARCIEPSSLCTFPLAF